MTNPNKAELRRLAEAVRDDYWSPDVGMTTAETMYACAAAPGAVLSLLDDCEKAEAERDAALAEREELRRLLDCFVRGESEPDENQSERHMYVTEAQSLLAYMGGEIKAHTLVPDEVLRNQSAELEALRIQVGTLTEWYSNALDVISEVSAAIPGVTYMDPPDGGDVSIPEQIQRMAKDAERYRWIREQHNDQAGKCWVAVHQKAGWVSLDSAMLGADRENDLDLDSAVRAAMSQEAPNA